MGSHQPHCIDYFLCRFFHDRFLSKYPTLSVYMHKTVSKSGPLHLFYLRPASHDHPVVECELVEADLSTESISYEAVSRCWGKDCSTMELRMFERTLCSFYVSRNLKPALRALHKCNVTCSLPIDGICINQSNLKECSKKFLK